MVELIHYLNAIHPLSDEAIAALIKVARAKELRRGQVWLQEGAVCDKLTFVVKGLLKLYFETGSKEVILSFAKEKAFMVSAQSYFEQTPSSYTIRSIEQSVIVYVLFHDVQGLMEKYPEFNIHLLLIARQQITELEYHTGLLMLSRRERFERIALDHLWMSDGSKLSDKMLAAFLGMTPNCLCGFRKQL